MGQSTLWGAIDRDRRQWIRAGALVVALLMLLGIAVWIVAASHSVRALQLVVRVLVPLGAVLMFPLVRTARELRAKQAIGAVPVATGMLPDTKKALHDVMLAAGLTKSPVLLMYLSDAPNAFATRAGGAFSISVSSGFGALPRAEQRAGIAMLVGRDRVDTASFVSEHQLGESLREDPIPPDRDPTLFAAWLETAFAGDREGLKILKEPAPMIELLERLSVESTVVPLFGYAGGHDAVFGFLAWPYLDTAKVLSEEMTAHGEGMPPEAAAAVAALIAEELIMRGPLSFSGTGSSASISGAEALRALRLREFAGAEGAVAGSTTTAARRRAREKREAAATASGRDAIPEDAVVDAPIAQAPRPEVDVAPLPLVPVAAVAPVMPWRGERITVACPACRAGNAPLNRTCVACGERMPDRI